jgi:branched-chain amino acid transport system ATP-binding protein
VALVVQGLQVQYGRRTALSDVALVVQPGAVTSVVGPNGAGKSTLLNSIGGLVAPSAGQVLLDGTDVTGKPAERVFRDGLALVPEGKRVFGTLSVEENMRLAAAAFGRRSGAAGRIDECLGLFPRLQSRRAQRASFLSGGEQQQLMIARSLVGSPRYLLLDEPSMGLSPQVVQEVFKILARLAGEGVGVLLVEQFVQQAVAISSQVHVLARGRLAPGQTAEQAKEAIARGDFFQAYSGRSGEAVA